MLKYFIVIVMCLSGTAYAAPLQVPNNTPFIATGGTSADNAIGRASKILNVKSDFGAAGDGSTNDTTVLQAAFNQASSASVSLFMPCGTYIAENLTIPANLKLNAAGAGCTIIKRPASGTAGFILAAYAANWHISDITLDGNKANNSVAANNIAISGSYNFTVDHLVSKNALNTGLYIYSTADQANSTQSSIRNSSFLNNTYDGFSLSGSAWYLSVTESSANGNGNNGFTFQNIGFPYTSSYKATISYLTVRNVKTNNNSGNGLALSGYVQVGATSYATSVNGPGNDPIYAADVSGISASGNSKYGVINQTDASSMRGVHTHNNGASCPLFCAGVLSNSENANISDINVDEPLTYYGIDAGGCYYCSIDGVVTQNSLASVNIEATQFTSIKNVHCNSLSTSTAAFCVKLDRVGGTGTYTTGGAPIFFPWDANHVSITDTRCVLNNSSQACVAIKEDPQYVSVTGSRSSGNENYTAFQFECTVGCNFHDNKTDGTDPYRTNASISGGGFLAVFDWEEELTVFYNPSAAAVTSIYPYFVLNYLSTPYRMTITAGGSGYANPIATSSGGGCTSQPLATVGVRTDTNAIVNGKLGALGAGCSSTPTCTITDSGGSGSGATCTFAMQPWGSLIGKSIRLHSVASQVITITPGSRLYTPSNLPVYLPLRSMTLLEGDSNGGSAAWWIYSPTYEVVSPYAQSLSTIAATGSTRTTATTLTATDNNVTTATVSTATGVCLPDSSATLRVRNATAIAINVYPCSATETINGGSAGVAVSLASGAQSSYVLSGTNWLSAP